MGHVDEFRKWPTSWFFSISAVFGSVPPHLMVCCPLAGSRLLAERVQGRRHIDGGHLKVVRSAGYGRYADDCVTLPGAGNSY